MIEVIALIAMVTTHKCDIGKCVVNERYYMTLQEDFKTIKDCDEKREEVMVTWQNQPVNVYTHLSFFCKKVNKI